MVEISSEVNEQSIHGMVVQYRQNNELLNREKNSNFWMERWDVAERFLWTTGMAGGIGVLIWEIGALINAYSR